MGKRDIRGKETKKQKKVATKVSGNIVAPPPPVEVVKRGKKEKAEAEE